MPRRVNRFLLASAVLLLSFGSGPARADLIGTVTPTVTPQGGGLFLYSYLVANSIQSTAGMAEFDVSVATSALLSAITNPNGFLALYTPGDTFIQYLSTDPSTDIAPGSSGTFSFTANLPPMSAPYLLRGFDASSNVLQRSGNVLAPAVPEPSVLLLALVGGLTVFGPRAVRRFNSSPAC